MIKLKIRNWLQRYDSAPDLTLAPYDEEKWRDGKVHEFDTLRECQNFLDACDIRFTEEARSLFDLRYEGVLEFELSIDTSDSNMLALDISKYWKHHF